MENISNMPSLAIRRFSMRNNVLMIVILHALLHDTIWLKTCVIQAKSYSGSTKDGGNMQKSDVWNDNSYVEIKSTGKPYSSFGHKIRGSKFYFATSRWLKSDVSAKNRKKRDSSSFEFARYNKKSILLQSKDARMADFSYANLSKIVRLSDLSNTKFTEIELGTMQKDANVLSLAHNNIEYLDESVAKAFENIERLDLAHNKLENFNLSIDTNYSTIFSRLKILNLTGNRLKYFQSAQFKSLKVIDLSCNLFSEPIQFNLSQLICLHYVDLSCNLLNTLRTETLQNMTNLKVLNLAGNHILKIEKNYFDSLTGIELLILSNNNINDIESDAFEHLGNLQFLDLSNNNLSAHSLHALQNIPNLSGLSVAYNKGLGNALQGFVTSWSIKEFDVSGTGLIEIPAALAQSVHSLNLSRNHFTILRCGDLDSYPLMKNLDMSFCNINDIEDDAFGRLEILTTLNIHNNNLSRIPSILPSRLVYLNLKNNRIMDIRSNTFVPLSNLQMLDLSGNKIMYVPGLPLPKLTALNLRSAYVKRLSQSVIKMSPKLKDIFLDDNPIKCSELLIIAEWATPCRIYKTDDSFFDSKGQYIEIFTQALEGFDLNRWLHQCCQQPMLLTEKLKNESKFTREYSINTEISRHNSPKVQTDDWNIETKKEREPTDTVEVTTNEQKKPTPLQQETEARSKEKFNNSSLILSNDPKNLPNFITRVISKNIDKKQLMETNSVEAIKYQKEGHILESFFGVENNKEINSDSRLASPRQQTAEMSTIPERKFLSLKSHDLSSFKKKSRNIDYNNDLQGLDNASSEITDSLHNDSYRVIFNSLGILTFLCIAATICFLVCKFYLYKCLYSRIEKEKCINIAHLQTDRLRIETMHQDKPDAIW